MVLGLKFKFKIIVINYNFECKLLSLFCKEEDKRACGYPLF